MSVTVTITGENCEECERTTYFSLNALIAQGLIITYVVNSDGNNAVNYEGYWTCQCGHDNTTIGEAEVI
jgi:hypothetical protein